MTLGDLFALSLSGRRDAPALDGDRRLTFGELDAEVDRLARVLASRGVGSGSRVCLYLRNSPALVAVYLAILRLGAIVVPMNILYRDRELKHIIGDADPVAVIADGDDLEMIPAPWTAWPLAELVAAAAAPPDRPTASPIDADAPALIIYTSGTTGAPKGAVLTHNMLCTNALALVTCWQMTAADRLHLTLPLFHVHGLCVGIHSWLISGCLLRLEERFDHQSIARQMLAFRPTVFFGVPTMYVRLLEVEEAAAREIGSRMRLFVSGSAPLPARVWEDFEARFGHRILERYGMSETLINMSNPCVGERRPGSIGLPLPGVSVRIVDDEGEDVGDDQAGELWVRGPNVLREYWRNPAATAAAFADGWFRTGDIGRRADDGYYTLHGRRSDLIISGGFNIYPREIEDFLCEQPGVAEAAVVGVADERRGEVPAAFIVAADGWEQARVERACREQLASFKVPRTFTVVERLPKTALGKVQKSLLAAELQRREWRG
jgi:malonyl-CoA/methylmalonyl-CoA synthetase